MLKKFFREKYAFNLRRATGVRRDACSLFIYQPRSRRVHILTSEILVFIRGNTTANSNVFGRFLGYKSRPKTFFFFVSITARFAIADVFPRNGPRLGVGFYLDRLLFVFIFFQINRSELFRHPSKLGRKNSS